MHFLKEIGDPDIKYYQKFVIVTGIIMVFLFILVAVLSQNEYYKIFPLIIFVFIAFLTFLYSKIYSVKYNSRYFYIENLFRKIQIDSAEFVKIQKIKHAEFLFMIKFKNQKFLGLVKSTDIIRNIFKSKDILYNNLTLKVKKDILQKHK